MVPRILVLFFLCQKVKYDQEEIQKETCHERRQNQMNYETFTIYQKA